MEQQLEILINRAWIAPWADRLMAFLTNYGAWAPWLVLLLLLGIVFGNFRLRVAMLAAVLAIGLSDGIGVNLLKHAVGRPRPSQVGPGVRLVELAPVSKPLPKICGVLHDPVVKFPHGMELPVSPGVMIPDAPTHGRSFPSGHAANNMAVATVLILFFRRAGWLYLPIALLIGYSRIYTGSHWPLDVLAGWSLGVLGGWLAVTILRHLWKRFGPVLLPRLAARHPDLTGGDKEGITSP
jgi:undecaprenyl-diphosphatase